jgi:serine/threonine protein kinase
MSSAAQGPPETPRRLGNYHVLEAIGQGGMGNIFLAKRVGVGGFEKAFVIKCMLESLAGDAELEKMFINEARLAARLSHPNIAQIYDFGVVDGNYYIAMEHIAGEDVKRLINRLHARGRQIPVPIALRILIDLCNGLDYAHTLAEGGVPLGIIHRDVSPANVMVSYQGVVKLLDFGIAKAAFRTNATRTGVLKGKQAFLSPEGIAGLGVDPRSDVFCSGLVMHMLLCQRHPFWRGTGFATMQAIAHDPPADPRQQRPDLPEEVAAVIARALDKDRDRRFASAAEMSGALGQALAQLAPDRAACDVAAFMVDLFGEEAKQRRSSVPSVADATPTETVSREPVAAAATGAETQPVASRSREVATAEMGTSSFRTRRLPVIVTVVGFALAALLMVMALRVPPLNHEARRPPPPPAPKLDIVVPAPVPSEPVLAISEPPLRAPDPWLEPAPPTLDPPPAHAPLPAARSRQARLDRRRLDTVMNSARPRFAACLRRHAAALSTTRGQVTVGLVVAGSGKVVSVETTTPGIGSPALTSCLEGAAERLRFPRHAKRRIGFAFPLASSKSGP